MPISNWRNPESPGWLCKYAWLSSPKSLGISKLTIDTTRRTGAATRLMATATSHFESAALPGPLRVLAVGRDGVMVCPAGAVTRFLLPHIMHDCTPSGMCRPQSLHCVGIGPLFFGFDDSLFPARPTVNPIMVYTAGGYRACSTLAEFLCAAVSCVTRFLAVEPCGELESVKLVESGT